MDLIDRATVMSELEREVEMADDWKTAHEIANVVKYAPTIEAVPLEPLCEWLSRSALFNTGYRNKIGASMWKELIKQGVME